MRLVSIAVVALLAGCSAPPAESVDVLATFYPLAFLAERIVGDNLTVATLVPAGVEPHEYEPTTTDFVRVASAKLLFTQGAGFEAWVEQARAQARETRVVVATDGIALHEGNPAEDAPDEDDPHTWLSPILFARMSDNVERAISDAFPQHAAVFAANGKKLREELNALDAEFEEGLATCEVRLIITNHAAFGYLTEAYAFEQRGISGLSPEAEPDPQTIQELVDLAREHDISVIFFEELVSPRVAEVIADEVGGQARILSPIEGIAAEERAKGTDYFTLMRHNLGELKAAMRCT